MNEPDLFLVGAGKAGTTSLYYYFHRHPEIFTPELKEINYFISDGTPLHFPDVGAMRVNERSVWDRDEYARLFEGKAPGQISCDCSPSYLYYPGTAERIHKARPDARIVMILRQPADRAFSAYLHSLRGGTETESSFEKALEREHHHVERGHWFHSHYVGASEYLKLVKPYFELFPREQIHVMKYDDFQKDQAGELSRLFAFLGVGDLPVEGRVEIGISGRARNDWLVRQLFQKTFLRRRLRRFVPEEGRRKIMLFLQKALLKRDRIDPDLRRRLTARFEPEFAELSRLTGKDFQSWAG